MVDRRKSSSDKKKVVAALLCFFWGVFGVHRFYVGKVGTGILMFFTAGGALIWWIKDFVKIIRGEFTDKEGRGLS